MIEEGQVKSTISEELLKELFNMFFDSIFGYKKDYENNFNPKIKEEFYNNIKANFSDSIEKKIKEAEEENEGKGKKIKKAMLAFSAMFDEGGIEGYENELAKEEQSKRLEKVFFSKKGALKYFDTHKDDENDEIIQEINKKINEKKEKINNLLKNFEDLKEKELNSILTKKQDFKETIDYLDKLIENNKNDEKAKSLKKELTKYKGKDPDALFLKDAVKDFVKYNKENCEIKDGSIEPKKGKEGVTVPLIEDIEYFKIDEIKKYLEEIDSKLKKIIETRNLILSGNDKIIDKLAKEYDKIQNSKYAKKIKEYQKNYSEKKRRANIITDLNKKNEERIEEIRENELIIEEAEKNKKEVNEFIKNEKQKINDNKKELKKIRFWNRILNKEVAKKAEIIKESIKMNELVIKGAQNSLKKLKETIKEKKKNNEDFKKEICESVKVINKNYHKGKVELEYKDLKGEKSSDIKTIYKNGVEKATEYADDIKNDKYKGKYLEELKKAQKKFEKELKKNISSSKKIKKAIRESKANNVLENKLKKPMDFLKEVKEAKSGAKSTNVTFVKQEEKTNELEQ